MRPNIFIRPGGPPAKCSPARKGWDRWRIIPSAVGAALDRTASQPDFPYPVRHNRAKFSAKKPIRRSAMILVTGATGTVGREVVAQLLAAGEKVRALTRNPSRAQLDEQVELAAGDLSQPETLAKAAEGVESVFSLATGPQLGTQETNLAQAAKEAGARHIVKLSGLRPLAKPEAAFQPGTRLASEPFRTSALRGPLYSLVPSCRTLFTGETLSKLKERSSPITVTERCRTFILVTSRP